MSTNYKQSNNYKSRWEAVLELQILRFFTTLAILTIVFVFVLHFVQQTSISSDKIKPPEASLAASSVENLFDLTQMKNQLHPESVNSPYMDSTLDVTNGTDAQKKIKK